MTLALLPGSPGWRASAQVLWHCLAQARAWMDGGTAGLAEIVVEGPGLQVRIWVSRGLVTSTRAARTESGLVRRWLVAG
ncbi:hypothetical protein MRX96_058227 [Rhipicephalus microplus]